MTQDDRLIIAVASGKGGTGKTSIATHLANTLSAKSARQTVCLVDLDVEAPDSLGYFGNAEAVGQAEQVNIMLPYVNDDKCDGCASCAKLCRFGAMLAIGGLLTIDSKICKGCGLCVMACPKNALSEKPLKIGETRAYSIEGLNIIEGRMEVGDIRSTSVIEAAKKRSRKTDSYIHIRDCPPGVSCPATHALAGAHFAVLVAEPTSFSVHDLEAAIRLCKSLNIPQGIVINKYGFGSTSIEDLCKKHSVPVIAKLAYSRGRAVTGARASLWMDDIEVERAMSAILNHIANSDPKLNSAQALLQRISH